MPFDILWLAVLLLMITSSGLLVSREWRWSVALLAIQYFAAFLLILTHWPLTLAGAQLVAGWMAAAVLGMTQVNLKNDSATEISWPQGRSFRLFAALLVQLVILASINNLSAWLPQAGMPVIAGSFLLVGLGLLHLGMTAHPLRVVSGLLTVLLGFETLFAVVENSILVTGLLVVITLGLALAGAYLLVLNPSEEPV